MPMPQNMESLIFKIHTDVARLDAKHPGFSEIAYQAFNHVGSIDKLPKDEVLNQLSKLLDTLPHPQRRQLTFLVCDFVKAVEIGLKDGFLRPSTSEETNNEASSSVSLR